MNQHAPIEPQALEDHGAEDVDPRDWNEDDEHQKHPQPALWVKKHFCHLRKLELLRFKPLPVRAQPLYFGKKRYEYGTNNGKNGYTSIATCFSCEVKNLLFTGSSGKMKNL